MKYRLIRSASTLAFATALAVVGLAAPASAVATTCPSTYSCLWRDAGYQTAGNTVAYVKFARYVPDLRTNDYQGTTIAAQDNVSSAANAGTQDTAYYYKNVNCSGAVFAFAKGATDGDFSNGSPAGNFNDTLSSAAFQSFITSC